VEVALALHGHGGHTPPHGRSGRRGPEKSKSQHARNLPPPGARGTARAHSVADRRFEARRYGGSAQITGIPVSIRIRPEAGTKG
jgi:hypothetical protein